MEIIRNSSKNIKGNFSGYLRDGISNIGEILDIYRERLCASGDVADLELQNRNLTTQLRKVTREQELQKKEYSILRKENEDLRKDIEMLRREMESLRDGSNTRGSPSRASEVKSADVRRTNSGEPLTRVEDFPPLPQRKPRVISSEILRDRTVKLRKYPTSASGSETDAIGAPNLHKKRSPSGGNRRTDRETNVVYPDEDTDSHHMLEHMNQQIQQLVANMEVLRARFGSKSEEPPKKKRTKKTSFRNDTETSGVSDGELIGPQTPSQPVEETIRKEGSRRGVFRDTPRSTVRSRRPPKTAAVSITSLKDDVSYADILKKARDNINLDSLGIETSKIRRGINGGIIIEIPGADGTTKADSLVGKLREVLDINNIRITRPTTMGELRIWSFDDSISPTEIMNEVSVVGDCDEHLVKLGSIRKMNNGLNSVWVKCPLSAAIKISASNKVKIGWTIARVELLEARPVQCFKCWRYGHVRTTCNFPEDRTGACFRCGERGHQIGDCKEDPRCVICREAGRPSDHRLGSLNICTSVEPIRGRRGGPVSSGRAAAQR
ncbi:uncharacterized protein LOC112452350 [Temnothorax curvispinosus]|uniref:Uncharacterized protein LOC112452350 n=1 Tax=Temnothorax curvispinosus TaxID=300111 RepID=A0A6J1PFF8_9HYME|nr:uncharacterized protein LOC112452350 [Temnothorax curvispinosus]